MGTHLSGKVAVVMGATSSLGAAISQFFAEGAALVLGERRADAGEALVRELREAGADVRSVAGDVGEERGATASAILVLARSGRSHPRSLTRFSMPT